MHIKWISLFYFILISFHLNKRKDDSKLEQVELQLGCDRPRFRRAHQRFGISARRRRSFSQSPLRRRRQNSRAQRQPAQSPVRPEPRRDVCGERGLGFAIARGDRHHRTRCEACRYVVERQFAGIHDAAPATNGWAATATSVALYYDASSTWTQPNRAHRLLRPRRLDCNTAQVLDSPLTIVGDLDHMVVAAETYANIRRQIDFGRPLCLRVAWSGGGAHFLAAKGYDAHGGGQIVNVDDPIYGPSDVTYSTLTTNYRGSGTWTHSYYTRP